MVNTPPPYLEQLHGARVAAGVEVVAGESLHVPRIVAYVQRTAAAHPAVAAAGLGTPAAAVHERLEYVDAVSAPTLLPFCRISQVHNFIS